MRASTLFALTLSVLVGLGVAIAAKMAGFFNPPVPPAVAAAVEPKKKDVLVLVASRNLFANDLLEPATVRLRVLKPEEQEHYDKHKDDYLPAAVQTVYMRVASKNIVAEQPLLKEHLKPMVKPESLDARLVAQTRALNVSLTKEESAGGLIQVGDWVDVMLTSVVESAHGSGSPSTRTACVAPRVRVVAKRNTLWPVFGPLSDDKPVPFTLEVNPYRAALIEFVRGKGQLSLAPLPATEQRKLEAMRAGLLKNPEAGGSAIQFISTDAALVSQEEARVESLLNGHSSVSEMDLIRIFGLTTAPPPETPVRPASIERIGGTAHKDPLYFTPEGTILAVGAKRVNDAPSLQKAGDGPGTGGQFKFAAPDCPTCKDKKAAKKK